MFGKVYLQNNNYKQNDNQEGIWSWNNDGQWQNMDPEASKQIDDELRNKWQNTTNTVITFPITKGLFFSHSTNRGVYFCNVQLNLSRTKIQSVTQQNTKTGFTRDMKRTPSFTLQPIPRQKSSQYGQNKDGIWKCPTCTYYNKSNHKFCGMCRTANPSQSQQIDDQQARATQQHAAELAKKDAQIRTLMQMIQQKDNQIQHRDAQIGSLQKLINQAASSYQPKQLQPIELKRILVVIVAVGVYDNLDNLPGTRTDKTRLLKLFLKNYKYDIIMNKKSYVTDRDVGVILNKAQEQFSLKKNQYQAIMVLYTGHGDRDHLLLSNYDPRTSHGLGTYPRDLFESYFNGYRIPETIGCYKLYFVDSCRGHIDSELIKRNHKHKINVKGNQYREKNKDAIWNHPEENRCIMFSNMDNYTSYEVPFDPIKDDIAWDKMDEDQKEKDNDIEYCGIFMNSIYHCFKKNSENKYGDNFSDLQDNMRKRTVAVVPIKDEPNCKVGILINESGNLMNSDKSRIVFRRNDSKELIEYQNKISLLNKAAGITQSNIQYA